MKLYHGTNKTFTDKLKNGTEMIDVTVGRGELGRGFYTTRDCGLVSIWAKAKFKTNASLIEFEVDEFVYCDLEIKNVKLKEDVLEIYNSNQYKLFNVDVVEGPFMNLESRIQHKFESRKAEVLLNKSISRIK